MGGLAASPLAMSWELTADLSVIGTLDEGLSFLDIARINPHGELSHHSAQEHGRVIAAALDTLSALETLVRWAQERLPGSSLTPEILAAHGAISIARGRDAAA